MRNFSNVLKKKKRLELTTKFVLKCSATEKKKNRTKKDENKNGKMLHIWP